MRITGPVSTLSLSILASLIAACHGGRGDRGEVDAGTDPAAALCSLEPYRSSDTCKGGILIQLNTCPTIMLTATPLRVAPGQRIALSTTFVDAEANTVTAEWLADPDGSVDVSDPAVAYYTCESLGRKTITVVATDQYGCESVEMLELSCVDPSSLAQPASAPMPTP